MTCPSQAGFKSNLSHFLNKTLNLVRGIKRQALLRLYLLPALTRDVKQGHPVLLNRAPTLHRLGIQLGYPGLQCLGVC
jgi:hypothetical protein